MMLMDVNVLVYAHREDAKDHRAYRDWLESVINSNIAYGFSELVLSGFIRVVTHPKVFEKPSTPEVAVGFAQQIRSAGHAVCLAPGKSHWDLFLKCVQSICADEQSCAVAADAGERKLVGTIVSESGAALCAICK
jgi:toxin-antitoxin system PIN domain toxin